MRGCDNCDEIMMPVGWQDEYNDNHRARLEGRWQKNFLAVLVIFIHVPSPKAKIRKNGGMKSLKERTRASLINESRQTYVDGA